MNIHVPGKRKGAIEIVIPVVKRNVFTKLEFPPSCFLSKTIVQCNSLSHVQLYKGTSDILKKYRSTK